MAGVNIGSSEPGGTVLRLERSMLTSWPALSTAFDGDWVIRLANGVTKRSNSVTCLGSDASDLDARIDRTIKVYQRHGLPPVFRVSPLAPPVLDETLDRGGWRRFDESIVMTVDLAADAALGYETGSDAGAELGIATEPDAAWLDGCCRIDGMSRTSADVLARMLGSLVPLASYGRVIEDARISALALAVVDIELVGLFEVMTATDRRRRGLARLLLPELLRWGQRQGAETGWLAVAAANGPAVRLYQALGFREIYRYHYRAIDQT